MNEKSTGDNEERLSELEMFFYGEPEMSDNDQVVKEMLHRVESKGIKEKCIRIANKRKESIHIGRLVLNRAASIALVICLFTVLFGGTAVLAYNVISGYISGLNVEEKGDHSETKLEYEDYSQGNTLKEIKDYIEPGWIPDGYLKLSESKKSSEYHIIYESVNGRHQIVYVQTLPSVKGYYGAENGETESVEMEGYTGQFIKTEKESYLIVTDGVYVYSLIADNIKRNDMMSMLPTLRK